MQRAARSLVSGASGAVLLVVLGCGPRHAAPPPAAPYQPEYTYSAESEAKSKQDVTVAVINPVVKGSVYGADGRAMLEALPTALADLITAKGLRYRGPFETLDEMTFPDKKASDLGLYAEIDVTAGWRPENDRSSKEVSGWSGNTTVTYTCDVNVVSEGKVSFVLIEPMSGETVWRKTIPIAVAPVVMKDSHDEAACRGPNQATEQQTAAFAAMTGRTPAPRPDEPPLDGELGNTYRRQLELTFVAIMKGIDKYMNADEMATLKTQAAELKEKKAY